MTVSAYYVGFVIDRAWLGADPEVPAGEVCGHSHRTRDAAAGCARRAHKRLSFKGRVTGLRAYTAHVHGDGTTEGIAEVET